MLFLLQFQNIRELSSCIKKQLDLQSQYGLPPQPFIVICGPLQNIEETFLIVNNWFIKCGKNPVNAVDLCFKFFYASPFEYSIACNHIWAYFQLFHYGIPESSKKKNFWVFQKLELSMRKFKI